MGLEQHSNTFNLVEWAKRHGYCTRNLNDGRPLRPLKSTAGGPRLSKGYSKGGDRMDVIIGKQGYIFVDAAAPARVGFYLCKEPTEKKRFVPNRKIEKLSGQVTVVGDFECAGDVPFSAFRAILNMIQPYRTKPASQGDSTEPPGPTPPPSSVEPLPEPTNQKNHRKSLQVQHL